MATTAAPINAEDGEDLIAALEREEEETMAALEKAKQAKMEDDDDEASYLDDEVLGARERHLEAMKEGHRIRQEMIHNGHGSYSTLTPHSGGTGHNTLDKEILRRTTASRAEGGAPAVIVHFRRSGFQRCLIVDVHLKKLAVKHFDTLFLSVDVEYTPFLVERLQIRMLPCILSFLDGQVVDRVTGFERLGNVDDFRTGQLEKIFVDCGVVQKAATKPVLGSLLGQGRRSVFQGTQRRHNGDSDSDQSDHDDDSS